MTILMPSSIVLLSIAPLFRMARRRQFDFLQTLFRLS